MSTIFDHATYLRGLPATDAVGIGRIVRQCWKAFQKLQLEQAAIAQLSSMNDRELRDIGLNRSDIGFAVKGQLAHTRGRGS